MPGTARGIDFLNGLELEASCRIGHLHSCAYVVGDAQFSPKLHNTLQTSDRCLVSIADVQKLIRHVSMDHRWSLMTV